MIDNWDRLESEYNRDYDPCVEVCCSCGAHDSIDNEICNICGEENEGKNDSK